MSEKPSLRVVPRQPRGSPRVEAPKYLTSDTRAWFESMVASYRILDPAGLRTLAVAGEALDEMNAARASLRKSGPEYLDRNGIRRRSPAADQLDRSRRAFLHAMRMLRLETGEE